jgi:hypothetical protein
MNSGGRKEQKIQNSLKELFIKLDKHEKFNFKKIIIIIFIYRCDTENIYYSVGYPPDEINIQKDMIGFNRTIMSGLNQEAEVYLLLFLFN